MDIRQLTYFVRVVESGSFSRAAAFLHIAQPALSRQVSSLETELKQRLLIRNGRGVTPTDAGERLLEHARSILDLFERAHDDMENARLGRSGAVAIGMPNSLSNALSSALIRRLRAELPDAKVHILNGRSTQVQEWILSGRLDMAVLFDAPSSPLLEINDLVEERLHLFEPLPPEGGEMLGPDVSLKELSKLPLIITSRPNRIREILENEMGNAGLKLQVLFELDSLDATFDMVHDRVGVTVASLRSRRLVGPARNLRIRPIIEPELALKVQLVQRARRLNNPLQEAAFRILQDLSLRLLS